MKESLDKSFVVGGELMDLSKSFDCVPYNHIHFSLLHQKQWVQINNINSLFLNVIFSIPLGSIIGPILFNCFFNDFFYIIGTAHNSADDNTLTASTFKIRYIPWHLNAVRQLNAVEIIRLL